MYEEKYIIFEAIEDVFGQKSDIFVFKLFPHSFLKIVFFLYFIFTSKIKLLKNQKI